MTGRSLSSLQFNGAVEGFVGGGAGVCAGAGVDLAPITQNTTFKSSESNSSIWMIRLRMAGAHKPIEQNHGVAGAVTPSGLLGT